MLHVGHPCHASLGDLHKCEQVNFIVWGQAELLQVKGHEEYTTVHRAGGGTQRVPVTGVSCLPLYRLVGPHSALGRLDGPNLQLSLCTDS